MKEQKSLNSDNLDLQMIFLYQCERCHKVMQSLNYLEVPGVPAIQYIAPKECLTCRDQHVGNPNVLRVLPSTKNSLLAKCKFTSCCKVFNARASWVLDYYTENKFPQWQPILVETDVAKIKRLIPNWQDYTFLVQYIKNLEITVSA